MTRTAEHFDRKRNEILRKVWGVFLEKGYENTTLAVIISELGVSKGAFYHYFPTKEACADAAVEMFARECYEKVAAQTQGQKPAEARFEALVTACAALSAENETGLSGINTARNAVFHQKLMAALVRTLAPLFEEVIVQGVREGVFTAEYPLETAQMILTLTHFYFDADLFGWDPADMPKKLNAFTSILTAALRANPDVFAFLNHNHLNI